MTGSLRVDHTGRVLVLTIDRPHVRNAVDPATVRALTAALRDATADAGTRAVVLTGAGDTAFGSGMDLRSLAEERDAASAAVRDFQSVLTAPDRLPLVAAVNGAAQGGGFELVLRCDLVVVAEHATFGLPEIRHGLLAGGGGTLLPARIPLAVALEIGLLGDPIDAGRADGLGLVNRVVPAAELVGEAIRLAERLAAQAPLALAAMRRIMWTAAVDGAAAAWAETLTARVEVGTSADAREGVAAFRERRAPRWTGT